MEYFYSLVREYRSSGMSCVEFCQQRNVNFNEFRGWIISYSRQKHKLGTKVSMHSQSHPAPFARVVVQAAQSEPCAIQLKLPLGLVLNLEQSVSPQWLADFVRALQ